MLIDAHCVLDLFKEMSPVMFVHKKKKKKQRKVQTLGKKVQTLNYLLGKV